MTLAEITETRAHELAVTKDYEKAGITLEENSPDEIAAAVSEILEEIEGRTTMDSGDEERRKKMRVYIRRAPRYDDWQFDVSPYYLRKHEALL